MTINNKILRPPEPPRFEGMSLSEVTMALDEFYAEQTRWLGMVTQNEYMSDKTWSIVFDSDMLNGWTTFSISTWGAVAYIKLPGDVVMLSGLIQNGTINTDAFLLPEGYRPPGRRMFATYSNTGVGRVEARSDGYIRPVAGGTTWFSLNPVIFKAL